MELLNSSVMKNLFNFIPGIARVTSNIIPLVTLFFLSKFVPISELGVVTYLSALISIVGVMTDFGLPEAVQRLINPKNVQAKLAAVIYFELFLVLAVTAGAFVVDLLSGGAVSKGNPIVFLIFIFSASNVFIISYNAIEKYFKASFLYFLSSVLFLIITIVSYLLGANGVNSFLFGRLISWVIVSIWALWGLRKLVDFKSRYVLDIKFFNFALGSFLITGSYVLINNWDSIVVSNIFGDSVNGVYRSALILGGIPLLLTTILSTRYLPFLAKIWDSNGKKEVKSKLFSISLITIVLSVLGLLVVVVSGKILLAIFFNQFIADNGYTYLILGYVASVAYTLGAVNGIYLYVAHKVRFFTVVSVFCALLFVLLSYLAATKYGVESVPLSLIMSNLIFSVIIVIRVWLD